jgi:hypothetical protein
MLYFSLFFLLDGNQTSSEEFGQLPSAKCVNDSFGRKVQGSKPDEVIELFPIYLILPTSLGPGVYSAFNRKEYRKQKKKFLGNTARSVRKTDKLTAICEPIV